MATIPFPAYRNALYEAYKGNVHSQNGEDGVIAEILKRLGIASGWLVESGAWDGVHLSNTYALLDTAQDFKALYIESDPAKYRDLLATCERLPPGKAVPVQATLRADEDTLGDIMRRHNLPPEPALLSIDIDSWDYDVWARLQGFRPAVVVIEINSEVPPLDWRVHGRDGWADGTSFLPMLLLGATKGYRLAAHCGNMIFVRDDLWPLLGVPEGSPFANFHTRWLPRSSRGR